MSPVAEPGDWLPVETQSPRSRPVWSLVVALGTAVGHEPGARVPSSPSMYSTVLTVLLPGWVIWYPRSPPYGSQMTLPISGCETHEVPLNVVTLTALIRSFAG